jgi:hypothetical protein
VRKTDHLQTKTRKYPNKRMDTSFRTTQKLVAPEKEPITPFIAKVRTTTLTPSRRNVFFAPFHAKTRTFAKTGSGQTQRKTQKRCRLRLV